ncbi:resolvase domain-containing protein [Caballeronia calidae]|uniref:Resolvase domain-containing protein n=1 Tax=Caballeronia calidae TaxID=1777139 RepID=A0A158DKT2_9BURK|nr:recombinase family protein [Caballeronia calidae]SAK95249.1 resolvase domain-containing protein [Caballeronia calidae]
MSRIFMYARVSTTEQTTDNQITEVKSSGFAIEPHRIFSEQVSGSTLASKRPVFKAMRDKMEKGDVLVITKMDRLGRDAIDVSSTVKQLAADGIRVHCLQLGGTDLTSAAGKMVMDIINTMAEFERNLIIERTNAGLKTAKERGALPGRPPAFTDQQKADLRAAHASGTPIRELARQTGKDRAIVQRAIRPTQQK